MRQKDFFFFNSACAVAFHLGIMGALWAQRPPATVHENTKPSRKQNWLLRQRQNSIRAAAARGSVDITSKYLVFVWFAEVRNFSERTP